MQKVLTETRASLRRLLALDVGPVLLRLLGAVALVYAVNFAAMVVCFAIMFARGRSVSPLELFEAHLLVVGAGLFWRLLARPRRRQG